MALFGWFAGTYAVFVVTATAFQRKLMYPAPTGAVEPEVPGGMLHRISRADERTVYAFHVPAPRGAATIVHFHGNGEALADQGPLVRALTARGFGVLALEYPGYGLAHSAKPSETALYEDAERGLEYLRDRLGVPAQSTILLGQSLGTGVAVEMACRGYGHRLVLLSPFTSMTRLVKRIVPVLPASLVVRDRYDNIAKAPALNRPVLIIHGERDEVIPADMGRQLGMSFPDARIYISPNAGHNDLFVLDSERILDSIVAFAGDKK